MVSHKGSCTSYSRDKSGEKQRSSALIQYIIAKNGAETAQNVINSPHRDSLLLVLAAFEKWRRMWPEIEPRYEYIAAECKLSRSHIATLLQELKRYGIISWIKRAYTSNLYQTSSYFDDREFRNKLAPYSRIFAYLAFSLIFSFKKLTMAEYHRKKMDIKYERFQEYSANGTRSDLPITGSVDRKDSNIKSFSKVYNQDIYISPPQSSSSPDSQGGADRREPSQSAEDIYARARLTPTAVRAAMLLGLEGEERYQLLEFSDQELDHAANKLRSATGIIDKVKWFKTVCLNHRLNGEKKGSNYPQNQRDSRAQHNRQGEGRSGQPRESLATQQANPLPTRYKRIERCTKDDEGAQYNSMTGVWYREVWQEKRTHGAPATKPTLAELEVAFDKRPSTDPFFNAIKDVILERSSKNQDLDFGVIAEGINSQTYGMKPNRSMTEGDIEARTQRILSALRHISDNTR